jgi:NRAMP (natural resistance-associated macrophage protein)-like metal ion transporter
LPQRTDPILAVLDPHGSQQEPSEAELRKKPPDAHHGGKPRGIVRAFFVTVLGPGLITGASDSDPSGIGTYSQAGSQFGFSLLWLAPYAFPLIFTVQELAARIALHTGDELTTSLRKRFPTWLVSVCVIGLVVANVINAGADLGAVADGIQLLSGNKLPARVVVVPIALALLLVISWFSFHAMERVFKYLTLVLFAYVIAVFIAGPPLGSTARATFVPHFQLSEGFIALAVAILGTTISPYLFFWESATEVDEQRIDPEKRRGEASDQDIRRMRIDVLIGMFFSVLVMYCIILTTTVVLHGHGVTNIQTAQEAAQALKPVSGSFASTIFSLGMIGTGLLAIPILVGTLGYAIKGLLNFRGSLVDRFRYRPTFYGVIAISLLLGLIINFTGVSLIRALVVSAIINGLVAPPILVLMTLLSRDEAVMGDRRSGILGTATMWLTSIVMTVGAVALVATLIAGAL